MSFIRTNSSTEKKALLLQRASAPGKTSLQTEVYLWLFCVLPSHYQTDPKEPRVDLVNTSLHHPRATCVLYSNHCFFFVSLYYRAPRTCIVTAHDNNNTTRTRVVSKRAPVSQDLTGVRVALKIGSPLRIIHHGCMPTVLPHLA